MGKRIYYSHYYKQAKIAFKYLKYIFHKGRLISNPAI